jgi:hypothetical protein
LGASEPAEYLLCDLRDLSVFNLDSVRYTQPKRVFLLSPANCAGKRAGYLLSGTSASPLAARLRNGGAPIGELFAFMSALYFRGKLAYASAFGRAPAGWEGAQVIVPGQGLWTTSTLVDLETLQQIASVPVDLASERYTVPLQRDVTRLADSLAPGDTVVLLGSIATSKYLEPLTAVLGDHLRYPAEFVGMGDMQRGSVMLRCVAEQRELTYIQPTPVAG